MAVVIDTLTRKDVPQFIKFLRLGFGPELKELGTDLFRLEHVMEFLLLADGLPLKVIKRISGHEAFVLLARRGKEPVGCLTVVGRKGPGLTGAYVLPEFRGKGIGSRLIEEALSHLRQAGYKKVHASPLNAVAQHMIEKVGFTPDGYSVVYEHPLPLNITSPAETRIRRMHKNDLPSSKRVWHGRRYNVRFFGPVFGVHVRQLTVVNPNGAVLCGTLFAIERERVGEVHPTLLISGEERGLFALLKAGEKWFRQMGKELIDLSISADDEALATAALKAGFTKKRKWVHFSLDLGRMNK